MYAVISSPKYWKILNECITDKGEQILLKAIDTDIDIAVEFERIGRIAIRHLIIDISSIGDHKRLIQAIKRYRIMNDKAQIIIIAPGSLPGNETLHQLVSMGIYDILTPDNDTSNADYIKEQLIDCIDNPSTYKRAVKYFIEVDTLHNQNINAQGKAAANKTIEERTVTITREKIIGTVVIAVVGAMGRIGTTHTSIAISQFLKNKNFRVAILELHKSDDFTRIKNSYLDIESNNECFVLNDIDFYPYSNNLNVLDVLQEDYNYIVIDMGQYSGCDFTEFKRANERIVIGGVKDWEIYSLEELLRDGDTIYKNSYCFNFCDKTSYEDVKKNMDQLKCYSLNYNPNPFILSNEYENNLKTILKDVLPNISDKSSNNNNIFSKFIKDKLKKGGE